MACWISSGPPYLGLDGRALRADAAAFPVPTPRWYAYAAEPMPTRLATMVDVGKAEGTPPQVFEDAGRLPKNLTSFKVLKAGRSMFKVRSRWVI